MFCTKCGNTLNSDTIFCPKCGNKCSDFSEEPSLDFEKTVGPFSTIPESRPTSEPSLKPSEELDLEKTVGPFSTIPESRPTSEPSPKPSEELDLEKTVGPFQTYRNNEQPNYSNYAPPATANTNSKAHSGFVGFGTAVKNFFKNYVNFKGRASRSEYWWIALLNALLFVPLALISSVSPPVGGLFSLALMLPNLSISIRRFHDIGKSWAFIFMGLIPFAGFIIIFVSMLRGSDGDNKWGPGPRNN